MFRCVVWWLLLAVAKDAISSERELHVYCYEECYIVNFKSMDDTFAFQQITNVSSALYMENVLIKRIDQSILEKLPRFIDVLRIKKSDRLNRISVPKALRGLQVLTSSLRRIDITVNSSLGTLDILRSKIQKVPPTLENAKQLKYLKLRGCKLSAIDLSTFCEYSSLNTLDFHTNKIRKVVNTSTKKCTCYSSLAVLVLSNNRLTTVNMELFNVFTNLISLNLQNNRITTLAGRLGHNALATLLMGGNNFAHVDLCGWYVPSAQLVSFALNQLSTVPECINNWTSISALSLNHNQFARFSIEKLSGMNNLKYLFLQCNKLTEVMLNSVHFPPNLEYLNMDLNNLTALDLSFIPVRTLAIEARLNVISSFNLNNSSHNVTRLEMEGNPMDCTWRTPLEQLYGECEINAAKYQYVDYNIKQCNVYRLFK